jgi:hypothetical protein
VYSSNRGTPIFERGCRGVVRRADRLVLRRDGSPRRPRPAVVARYKADPRRHRCGWNWTAPAHVGRFWVVGVFCHLADALRFRARRVMTPQVPTRHDQRPMASRRPFHRGYCSGRIHWRRQTHRAVMICSYQLIGSWRRQVSGTNPQVKNGTEPERGGADMQVDRHFAWSSQGSSPLSSTKFDRVRALVANQASEAVRTGSVENGSGAADARKR